ncbi:MAG: flagellar basal body-associated FliL family protein [Cellulomonas sp.]
MPIEQRVISTQKIGARNPSGGVGSIKAVLAEPEKAKRKPSKKLILIAAAVLVLVVGAAAYWFLLGPGKAASGGAPAAPPAPQPGTVLKIDAVSVNLADGHYLRLGLGLQLTKEVAEAPDPAKALDLAIALYSGHTVAEVSDPATRDALKAQLVTELTTAYEGEVMDVYLTNFVTQ